MNIEVLVLAASSINIVLLLFALGIIVWSVREFLQSSIGATLMYFLGGVITLGAIRVFLFLADNQILHLHEIGIAIVWHLLFYVAAGVFLIGGLVLVRLVSLRNQNVSFTKAIIINCLVGLIIAIIFLFGGRIDQTALVYYQGSYWNHFGLHHFIAFIMGGLIAVTLLMVHRRYAGIIRVIAMPMIAAVGILSTIHLWELLTESWQVLQLPDMTIELIEQFLWMPAVLVIIYAFIKFHQSSK